MKIILILSSLIISSLAMAQYGYSTKSKKAIKLFELGQKEPNISIDPTTNLPNFRKGIEYLEKSIEKDPSFWEAHLLAAEYYEYLYDYKSAIDHYEKTIQINPNHAYAGSTYFYLANLQFASGEYEKSAKNLSVFVQYNNANEQLLNQAYFLQASCEFALNAIKNPKKYEPINAGPGVNTANPEYFPTLTVDGKTLLFTRRIKDENIPKYQEQEDFFVSQKNEEGFWLNALAMPSNVNTPLNEGAPTISADGRSLIFVACSDQSGDNYYGEDRTGMGSCDLFYTKKIGNSWLNPSNLNGYVNTFSWESQPSLSADGKTLYYIRRVSKKGEMTNSDIYVSKLGNDGKWSAGVALPKTINTPLQEESVLIHPDGKTLYFASRGHIGMGGSDIYVTRMDKNGNWSRPENLGYPINTIYDENSLLVSADGELAFFASDREGGFGDLDIYYFEMPEEFKPTRTLYFDGIVFDAVDKHPIPGKFTLIDLASGEEVIVSEADKITGEFMVSLPINRAYVLNVSYPGYLFFSENFDMTSPDSVLSIHMDVPLVPESSDIPVELANVFFDFGKSTLRTESFIELDKLYDFLAKNTTISIEISGHTDTRGDDKENLLLSDARAKAVYTYIISKGIDSKRLSYKGYGETKPKITDVEIGKLTNESEKEKAHQSNRRTEYKIIKK
jgi:outer membrane protein OmpA-like peptidoglycan-associated protein/tetratricopeptide (TPR) repeat protein